MYRIAWLLILGLSATGCTYNMTASRRNLDPGLLVNIRSGQTLTITNAQASTEVVDIGSAGLGRSVEGNLHQWTEAAIESLKAVLKKKGVYVDESSIKVLQLSIESANLEMTGGGWGFSCDVFLNVTTGDQYSAEYVGSRGSWKYDKVCNAAVTESVSVMLKDEKILEYIDSDE